MAFEVKKMTLEDGAKVYSQEKFSILREFTDFYRAQADVKAGYSYWAVDGDRHAYFLRLPNQNVDFVDDFYLLGYEDELFVIHVPLFQVTPKVTFLRFPEAYLSNVDEIRQIILDAFKIGGVYVCGIQEEIIERVFPWFDITQGETPFESQRSPRSSD